MSDHVTVSYQERRLCAALVDRHGRKECALEGRIPLNTLLLRAAVTCDLEVYGPIHEVFYVYQEPHADLFSSPRLQITCCSRRSCHS